MANLEMKARGLEARRAARQGDGRAARDALPLAYEILGDVGVNGMVLAPVMAQDDEAAQVPGAEIRINDAAGSGGANLSAFTGGDENAVRLLAASRSEAANHASTQRPGESGTFAVLLAVRRPLLVCAAPSNCACRLLGGFSGWLSGSPSTKRSLPGRRSRPARTAFGRLSADVFSYEAYASGARDEKPCARLEAIGIVDAVQDGDLLDLHAIGAPDAPEVLAALYGVVDAAEAASAFRRRRQRGRDECATGEQTEKEDTYPLRRISRHPCRPEAGEMFDMVESMSSLMKYRGPFARPHGRWTPGRLPPGCVRVPGR